MILKYPGGNNLIFRKVNMSEQNYYSEGENPGLSEKQIDEIQKQKKPVGIIYSHSLPRCSNCGTIVRVPTGKTVECLSCGELLKSE